MFCTSLLHHFYSFHLDILAPQQDTQLEFSWNCLSFKHYVSQIKSVMPAWMEIRQQTSQYALQTLISTIVH